MMPYYYFDISDVLSYVQFNETLTGSQRVSLRIIGHLVDAHGPDRVRLIGYHPILRQPVRIDSSFLSGSYSFDQREFCNLCGLDRPLSLKTYLKTKYKSNAKRRLH